LFREAEELLEEWKHPDPYHAPTAPGGMFPQGLDNLAFLVSDALPTAGSKFERNIPPPILDREFRVLHKLKPQELIYCVCSSTVHEAVRCQDVYLSRRQGWSARSFCT
jgi:hypothetical protein